jgi:hypothetical protein
MRAGISHNKSEAFIHSGIRKNQQPSKNSEKVIETTAKPQYFPHYAASKTPWPGFA